MKCGRSRSEEKKWEDDGGRTCWPLWPRKSKARNLLMGPVKWETTTVGLLQAYCFALQGGRLSVSTNNTVRQRAYNKSTVGHQRHQKVDHFSKNLVAIRKRHSCVGSCDRHSTGARQNINLRAPHCILDNVKSAAVIDGCDQTMANNSTRQSNDTPRGWVSF